MLPGNPAVEAASLGQGDLERGARAPRPRQDMKKYVYPAVFTEEDAGMYSVEFKDLESYYTCGD